MTNFKFIPFIIFYSSLYIFAQSTSCDHCPLPEVVLYGIQMKVPQPPPDDSLGQYTTTKSQQAFFNWIALGDAQVTVGQIGKTDPEKDCVNWMYGSMAQQIAANPDTSVIVHQQNYSTGDLPPAGPVAGVDYIIWSSIDSSGGQYHFHVYLEDAYSRTRIASSEADFTDPNSVKTAVQNAIAQIEPVFDKIRTYQKNIRNLGGNDVAVNAKLYIIPSKSDLKGGETIPVEFQVKDCDGTPLSSRWIKISSTNGHFDKDSIQTDGSGNAAANFTADNVSDIANIKGIYFPYFTASHKRKGAWGDTTVNINYALVRNWVEKISEYKIFTMESNTNDPPSYGYQNQFFENKTNVTQFVVGDFQDSSLSVDKIVGAKGFGTSLGIRNTVDYSPGDYQRETVLSNSVVDPSEDFTGIGLDDISISIDGIIFTSGLGLLQTKNDHFYMAGSSIDPSPYESDTTITTTDVGYHIFQVGPNIEDGGKNATWKRTDSGFVFKGDYYEDTTITDTYSHGTETDHLEEHVVVNVIPYSNLTSANPPFESVVPREYKLFQNYPNPFNPVTIIKYQIPKISHVKLTVYDILGNRVAELVNGEKSSGEYSVSFNASSLTSGVYFYRIEAGNYLSTKKLILLK